MEENINKHLIKTLALIIFLYSTVIVEFIIALLYWIIVVVF